MIQRDYESYIIINGDLDDASVEEIITKYETLFQKHKVELKNTDRIGRRRLSYPIKRKQNGYYVCFEISAPASLISRLKRLYNLDENIIRDLTIFMDKKELQAKENHFKRVAAIRARIEAEKLEIKNIENGNVIKSETEKIPAEKVLETQ